VAEDIGANNRQNFYLILVPHSAALLLSILPVFDPFLAILLADVPLVLVELHNLHTHNHLQQHHRLGWRALRKRKAKRGIQRLVASLRQPILFGKDARADPHSELLLNNGLPIWSVVCHDCWSSFRSCFLPW
jgi:hypothetical protein